MRKPSINSAFIMLLLVVIIPLGWMGWSLLSRSDAAFPSDAPDPKSKVIMIVKYSGGLCSDGKVCSSEARLYDDGTFERHAKLSKNDLQKLTDTISATDFTAYKTDPDPHCASFADGQDEAFIFPQKHPDQTFTTCMLVIPNDDKSISFISDLVERYELKQ